MDRALRRRRPTRRSATRLPAGERFSIDGRITSAQLHHRVRHLRGLRLNDLRVGDAELAPGVDRLPQAPPSAVLLARVRPLDRGRGPEHQWLDPAPKARRGGYRGALHLWRMARRRRGRHPGASRPARQHGRPRSASRCSRRPLRNRICSTASLTPGDGKRTDPPKVGSDVLRFDRPGGVLSTRASSAVPRGLSSSNRLANCYEGASSSCGPVSGGPVGVA